SGSTQWAGPDVLKNDTARTILVQALSLGEGASELLEKLGYQAYALVQGLVAGSVVSVEG
ncbi:hypothetical protein HaLaN_26117, partial [Haematococcus lacustris]